MKSVAQDFSSIQHVTCICRIVLDFLKIQMHLLVNELSIAYLVLISLLVTSNSLIAKLKFLRCIRLKAEFV